MWEITINLEKINNLSANDIETLDAKYFDKDGNIKILEVKDYYVDCFLEELGLDKNNEDIKKYVRYTAKSN
jgi:predicted Zn-dependent protease with MMP-like domain